MTGEQFRELREQLGLTQVQLAERIDFTQGYISKWERNKKPIPLAVVELLLCWTREEGRDDE